MGNQTSSTPRTLESLSKEQVAEAVAGQGQKFEPYARLVRENGIDGALLADIIQEKTNEKDEERELSEILDELEVTSKLHRRVLKLLFRKAKENRHSDDEEAKSHADDVLLPARTVALPGSSDDNVVDTIPAVTVAEVNAYCSHSQQAGDSFFATHQVKDCQTRLASTPEETAHLPGDFFAPYDASGTPRPPIPRYDLARCASVERLGLHTIEPDDPALPRLQTLIEHMRKLFGAGYARLQMLSHTHVYYICEAYDENLDVAVHEFLRGAGEILKFDGTGRPVVGVMHRNYSFMCNYAVHTGRLFMVPEVQQDQTFAQFYKPTPVRAYWGSPIFDSQGMIVAAVTMLDFKPRYDFTKAHEVQMLRATAVVEQVVENWSLRREVRMLKDERLSLSKRVHASSSTKRDPPKWEATIVFTDVQGSTSLWETNAELMESALKLHDSIMRRCIAATNGYEITTEGDAFVVAFHDNLDAIAFALKTQMELFEAAWPAALFEHPDACDDPSGSFRGLRVRMGIHHGEVKTTIHDSTRRIRYLGQTVSIAKSTEGMCHGGQILVTEDVWRTVSGMLEDFGSLGAPQVVDLGVHVLLTGESIQDGVIAKRILQLVPGPLAYDYAGTVKGKVFGRVSQEDPLGTSNAGAALDIEDASTPTDDLLLGELPAESVPASLGASLKGRKFPPAISRGSLSKSFHDAPVADGKATLVFVYPGSRLKEALAGGDDIELKIMSVLGKTVRSALNDFDGYECKEENCVFMAAFPTELSALQFGLSLLGRLAELPPPTISNAGTDWSKLIKIGVHSGAFSSCVPHAATGRADYYGVVVNRAARVAGAGKEGEVWLGTTTLPQGSISTDTVVGDLICTRLESVKMLKGVKEEMALYSCSWAA